MLEAWHRRRVAAALRHGAARAVDLARAGGPQAPLEGMHALDDAPEIVALAAWGTLSPLEPSENVLCLVALPDSADALVYHRYLQPFEARAAVLGRVRQDLVAAAVPRLGTAVGRLPSHVRLDVGSPLGSDGIRRLVSAGLAHVPPDRLETACRLLETFRGRPFERANHEAYLTMTGASRRAQQAEVDDAEDAAARREPSPAATPSFPDTALFARFWDLVTDPEHVAAERRAIEAAWDGVLAFQRSGARHPRKPALTWEQAARIAWRLAPGRASGA